MTIRGFSTKYFGEKFKMAKEYMEKVLEKGKKYAGKISVIGLVGLSALGFSGQANAQAVDESTVNKTVVEMADDIQYAGEELKQNEEIYNYNKIYAQRADISDEEREQAIRDRDEAQKNIEELNEKIEESQREFDERIHDRISEPSEEYKETIERIDEAEEIQKEIDQREEDINLDKIRMGGAENEEEIDNLQKEIEEHVEQIKEYNAEREKLQKDIDGFIYRDNERQDDDIYEEVDSLGENPDLGKEDSSKSDEMAKAFEQKPGAINIDEKVDVQSGSKAEEIAKAFEQKLGGINIDEKVDVQSGSKAEEIARAFEQKPEGINIDEKVDVQSGSKAEEIAKAFEKNKDKLPGEGAIVFGAVATKARRRKETEKANNLVTTIKDTLNKYRQVAQDLIAKGETDKAIGILEKIKEYEKQLKEAESKLVEKETHKEPETKKEETINLSKWGIDLYGFNKKKDALDFSQSIEYEER